MTSDRVWRVRRTIETTLAARTAQEAIALGAVDRVEDWETVGVEAALVREAAEEAAGGPVD